MMEIVWAGPDRAELNDAVAGWVAAKIGLRRGFGPSVTMGLFEEGKIVAGVVFHNYYRDEGVIEFSGASDTPRWMSRRMLGEMFRYIFDQLGCQLAVARVSERNTRLLRILSAYGFDHVLVPRLRGRDEGERIFTLADDVWRANGFHAKKEAS